MEPAIAARRAAVRSATRRGRRRVLVSAGAVAGLVAGTLGVALSPLVAVEEVAVVGADGGRAEEARSVVGVEPGDNLLFADVRGAREHVEELAWVAEADVRRVPPARLLVEVVERAPMAVVRLPDRSWIVGREGVVLRGGADEGLPRVDAPGGEVPGLGVQVTDAAIVNALAFHRGLPAGIAARVERYEAESVEGLRVRFATEVGPVWARVGRAEEVPRKAAVLSGLLDELPEEVTGAREVDVRAPDNPVLLPAGGG